MLTKIAIEKGKRVYHDAENKLVSNGSWMFSGGQWFFHDKGFEALRTAGVSFVKMEFSKTTDLAGNVSALKETYGKISSDARWEAEKTGWLFEASQGIYAEYAVKGTGEKIYLNNDYAKMAESLGSKAYATGPVGETEKTPVIWTDGEDVVAIVMPVKKDGIPERK